MVAAALSSIVVAAHSQPLELKGIQLGMTPDQVDEKAPGLNCAQRTTPIGIADCHYLQRWEGGSTSSIGELTHLADQLTSTWTFSFIDQRLGQIRIRIPGDSFEPIERALEAKYGKPLGDIKIGRNFFNAPIQTRFYVWPGKGEQLIAFIEDAPQPTGAVVLIADSYIKAKQAADAADDKRRAKGL